MKQVYKVTYPNGKIYVGLDITGTVLYLGSPNKALVAADLGLRDSRDFTLTLRKQVLWESATASDAEARRVETDWIIRERANDPRVGYNQRPRLAAPDAPEATDSPGGAGAARRGTGTPP